MGACGHQSVERLSLGGRKMMRLWNKSVFNQSTKRMSMDAALAVMFHRVSATMYLAFVVWGAVSLLYFIPGFVHSEACQWRVFFALVVIAAAAPACFGATFWPAYARLEAFFGSALVGGIIAYAVAVMLDVVSGTDTWRTVAAIGVFLVLPLARLAIVMMFLIRQAKDQEVSVERARRLLRGER